MEKKAYVVLDACAGHTPDEVSTGKDIMAICYINQYERYELVKVNGRYFEFKQSHPDSIYVTLGEELPARSVQATYLPGW